MPNLLRSVQRAEHRAASLPTGYRINLALYALVVLGVALIALEVKGEQPGPDREVQTLPRPVNDTTTPSAGVPSDPPVVLGPGDLTPTPPPAVTPGGVVIGQPAPAAPSTATGPSQSESADETQTETVIVPASPPPVTPIFTGLPERGLPLVPTAPRAGDRAAQLASPQNVSLPPPVQVSPVSIPPPNIPPPVTPRLP